MKPAQTIINIVILAFVVFFLFLYQLPTVCESTVTYKIGKVDQEFNISEDQFLADLKEASDAWNNLVGKQLIAYDPKSELSVNLVFDERQSLSDQIQTQEQQTKQSKGELETKLQEYKRRSSDFEARLKALNDEIQQWNARGGAPEDVYQRLKDEQSALEKEADELNALASELNLNVGSYNAQVDKVNQTEESLTNVLKEKPEAGLYDPKDNKIDVYFNTSKAELIHTLEHEFGHALGLKHVNNSQSIMYPKSTFITQPSQADVQELKNVCKKITPVEKLQSVLQSARRNIDDLRIQQ